MCTGNWWRKFWRKARPGMKRFSPSPAARRLVPLILIVFGPWLICGFAGRATAADKPAPEKTASPKPAAPPDSAKAVEWKSLFDGKTLAGWKVTDFAGRGEVNVKDGRIILESGSMTGVTWTNDLPRMNYEISLDAMRVEGSDFFCGLTFPVG